jgi:hypothetical protein
MKTSSQNTVETLLAPRPTPKQWAMFTLQYLSLRAALLAHVEATKGGSK